MTRLARVVERCLPTLLILLLIALLTSITATGVLIALVTLAALVRLTDPAVRARYRFPLALPIGAFALVSLCSALASDHRADSLLALRHFYLVVPFFVAVNEFRSPEQIRRALWWLGATVVVVSVYAMLQTLVCTTTLDVPAWVARALKLKFPACRQPSIEPFRAKGFFSIYMTLGGSLVVALSLLLAAAMLGRQGWRPLVQSAFGLSALALSYVRNAWLGLAAAVALLVLLSRRWAVLGAAGAAVAMALAVPSPLQGKILSMFDPASPSASERFYFWQAGARMVREAPLLGLGPGAVKRVYPAYKDPAARRAGTSHLHSNPVQLAAERGLLGLLAWCAIWGAFLVEAARIYRATSPARSDDRALVAGSLAAVVGFLVAGLFEYSFGDSEVIGLVWVVIAFPFVVSREASRGNA